MDHIQILQECYSRVTLIPVIGSGLSVPFGLPDWRTLIENSAEHFALGEDKILEIQEHLEHYEFVDAVDVILNEGVPELALQNYVSESMMMAKKAAADVDNNYSDLAMLSKVRFMTTNYDRYMNDMVGARTFLLEDLEHMPINQFSYSTYDHTVIPLHGEINRPESIVLSRDSYHRLYHTQAFHEQFQQLRTHFTFLFMGFSFEDEYVQQLFEKIVQRFEAQHFILFDESEKEKNAEKIERLKSQYGMEAVYYDASVDGHTKAISRWLHEIFELKDQSVDYSSIEKLPVQKSAGMKHSEKEIVDRGTQLIKQEQLEELYLLYSKEYEDESFGSKTASFKVNIICGLLWYYGFQRKDKESRELLQKSLQDPEVLKYKDRLAFMHGQLLWNAREFDKGIRVLEQYGGDKCLARLLLDILIISKEFLPEMDDVSGVIPVYGSEKRSQEEMEKYHKAYMDFKQKYINPDTYNLLHLQDYEDRESEQIAYYWLGIVAGQLFHEHEDAIQYLLRASELEPLMVVHEELAHNYFSLAEAGIRYVKDPKKYQLNVDYLIKAKIRFQYIMNFSDATAVRSMVEKSGLAYLQTLYWLKDFVAFYDFYNTYEQYLPQIKEILLLKAEADAEYEHAVDKNLLDHLSSDDRTYIEYCCLLHRAELFSRLNPWEAERLRNEIIVHAEKDYPIEDRRIFQIVLDTVFFSGNIACYEILKSNYPREYFADFMTLGFEDEMYGRIDDAGTKFTKAFETHKDYDGTFRIIKGFYVRNHKKKEFEALYDELMGSPPDGLYRQPQFYAEHIMAEINDWHDRWSAFQLYAKYYECIKNDMLQTKELEEVLKLQAADYSDYEARIAWNRYMLTKAPKYARIGIYDSILKLYVANSKYREASDVLDEMRKQNIPVMGNFGDLIQVCLRPQRKRLYCGRPYIPYYRSDKDYLDRLLNKANSNMRYRAKGFGAQGLEVILPIEYLLCMFKQNRQSELHAIGKIHIMYAGLINLQNSLWYRENPFLRMVLQWIERAGHVVMAAPDFMEFCKTAPNEYNREHRAEDIQMKLYSREHPDYIRL